MGSQSVSVTAFGLECDEEVVILNPLKDVHCCLSVRVKWVTDSLRLDGSIIICIASDVQNGNMLSSFYKSMEDLLTTQLTATLTDLSPANAMDLFAISERIEIVWTDR